MRDSTPAERCRNAERALSSYAAGAYQAQEVEAARRQGKRIVRLPDYSLIAGFIAPRTNRTPLEIGLDDPMANIDAIGRWIFSLYGALAPSHVGFEFALPFPTICEIAISLQRRAERLGEVSVALRKDSVIYTKLMRALESSDPLQPGVDDLFSDIKDVLDWLPLAVQSTGLEQFMDLAQSRRIIGLGAVFSRRDYEKARAHIIHGANGLTGLLMKYRRQHEREDRESFELRNRIDALNFCLGKHLNDVRDDTDMSFASPLSSSVRPEKFGAILNSRTYPQTLFLKLKASQIYSQDPEYDKETLGWLRAFGDAAAQSALYLKGVSDFTHMPSEEYGVVGQFFNKYGALLELNLAPKKMPSINRIAPDISSQSSAVALFESAKASSDRALLDLQCIQLAAPAEELLIDFDLSKFKSLRRALSKTHR